MPFVSSFSGIDSCSSTELIYRTNKTYVSFVLSLQDPQTSRTLTLISKTIQTLGSLSKSKSVSLCSFHLFMNSGLLVFPPLQKRVGRVCSSQLLEQQIESKPVSPSPSSQSSNHSTSYSLYPHQSLWGRFTDHSGEQISPI